MVPLRVLFLSSLVIVLCVHFCDAGWWRSPPRIRLPRIRLPRIRLPRIRLPRIRLPRIRLRRVLDKVKGIWTDIRETVSSIKDKIGYIIKCKQVSKLRIVDKCKGQRSEDIIPGVNYCRNITAPAAWGAPSLSSRPAMVKPVSTIALYIAEEDCVTADCKLQARGEHRETESYNFIVDGHGAIYEARGWNTQSDHHVLTTNKQTQYGVVLIATENADYELALTDLINCGISVGAINSNFNMDTGLIITF